MVPLGSSVSTYVRRGNLGRSICEFYGPALEAVHMMSAYILLARTHGVYLGERQENTVRVPGDKRKKKRKWF